MAEQDFQAGGAELVHVSSEMAALVELSDLEAQARKLAQESRAESTWRAYDSDFQAHTGLFILSRVIETYRKRKYGDSTRPVPKTL